MVGRVILIIQVFTARFEGLLANISVLVFINTPSPLLPTVMTAYFLNLRNSLHRAILSVDALQCVQMRNRS
jgi:hypothetical protein